MLSNVQSQKIKANHKKTGAENEQFARHPTSDFSTIRYIICLYKIESMFA